MSVSSRCQATNDLTTTMAHVSQWIQVGHALAPARERAARLIPARPSQSQSSCSRNPQVFSCFLLHDLFRRRPDERLRIGILWNLALTIENLARIRPDSVQGSGVFQGVVLRGPLRSSCRMLPLRNPGRRTRVCPHSGDPCAPSDDAPHSEGDGASCLSAALPPPPCYGGLRRDREPSHRSVAGPGSCDSGPCPPSAGFRMRSRFSAQPGGLGTLGPSLDARTRSKRIRCDCLEDHATTPGQVYL